MTWKEKLRRDPDLAELIIEMLKTELNEAKTRINCLENALKLIKSRVWEQTEETPTPATYMRAVARKALE